MSQPLSRDLHQARVAYEQRDGDMSIAAHLLEPSPSVNNEPHTKDTGRYLKSVVFGALDGIVTSFALVSGVAGAKLEPHIVLVLGLATLIADGISMGLGDYVSSKAELDYQTCEQERERWELDNFPEGEMKEMIQLYENKGFTTEDATLIISTMCKYEQFFVDHMLVQELGILPPDDDDNPAFDGFVTFLSFMLFGSVPLLAFLAVAFSGDTDFNVMFGTACILTAVTLVILGAVKGHMSGTGILKSSFMVFLNGVIASAAAFLIGDVLASSFR